MEISMLVVENLDILRAILESIHTGVYFVGRDQRIQLWNEGAERITGYLRQDVVGHLCKDFFPPQNEEDKTGVCEIGGALAGVLRDGKSTCSDVSIRHRAGHQVLRRVWAVSSNMAKAVDDEHSYDQVLRVMIVAFMKGTAPTMAVEIGRRAIPGHVRPTFQDAEKSIKDKGDAPAPA
jgi:PAS domain S-box-containing protein